MRGCRARTTKSKERVERYETLKAQAGAGDRRRRCSWRRPPAVWGKRLIELDHVAKTFGDRTVHPGLFLPPAAE